MNRNKILTIFLFLILILPLCVYALDPEYNILSGVNIESTIAYQAYLDDPQNELKEINYLIDLIKHSSNLYERNGKSSNGKKAAKHLRDKLYWLKDEFHSTEEFIEKAASYSSKTGEPYYVVSETGKKHLLKDVLNNELEKLKSFTKEVLDFESVSAGSLPTNFISYVGKWEVIEDDSENTHALAQLAENSGLTYNIVLMDNENYQDVDITVKIRAVKGYEDQGGGLVWRAKDESNYYIARYNPLEDNYRVYRVVNGRRVQLQSANIKHTEGWHTLGIKMKEGHIKCYYDGQKHLDVNDLTFMGAGKIGLWTKADAVTYFDDLSINKGSFIQE